MLVFANTLIQGSEKTYFSPIQFKFSPWIPVMHHIPRQYYCFVQDG